MLEVRLGLVDPATPLHIPTAALNLPTARACFRYRFRLGRGEYSMTEPHTPARRIATPTPQRVPRKVFCLVCGCCGGNIAVESGSPAQHVRCPSCSHRVKVVRSAPHECEYCGAQCRIDLTSGSMVATCNACGRSYTVRPVVARALRRHWHDDHRSRPRNGADPSTGPAVMLLVTGFVLLYFLVMLSLGLFGSGG